MATQNELREFPAGTLVLFKPFPASPTELLGLIVRNCGGGVYSIEVKEDDDGRGGDTSGYSISFRDNCYHADDPRVREFSPAFWEDGSGIFRIAPKELVIEQRLAALEKRVATLAGEFTAPVGQATAPAIDLNNPVVATPVRRGRGRPPKWVKPTADPYTDDESTETAPSSDENGE